MEDYQFRLARNSDYPAIAAFMRAQWDSPHPLIERQDLFDYYYRQDAGQDRLRFALCEEKGHIKALAGYIPASLQPTPDIWVSLWVADKTARGSGLELMAALPQLLGCRTLACNNIRPETQPFYQFLGFHTGRVGHFYRLAHRQSYQLAVVHHRDIPATSGKAQLAQVTSPAQLEQSGFIPPANANPYKDMWYIQRRFFAYPHQPYNVYTAALPGESRPRALLAARVIPAGGTVVLRISDYIGEPDFLPELGNAINQPMQTTGAEYADCYCAGIPAATMRSAGFAERDANSQNILPNYLQPPAIANTDYYYFTNNPHHFVLFKADGDQDRPNLPAPASTV